MIFLCLDQISTWPNVMYAEHRRPCLELICSPWRSHELSGIVWNDSVVAIIDLGNPTSPKYFAGTMPWPIIQAPRSASVRSAKGPVGHYVLAEVVRGIDNHAMRTVLEKIQSECQTSSACV